MNLEDFFHALVTIARGSSSAPQPASNQGSQNQQMTNANFSLFGNPIPHVQAATGNMIPPTGSQPLAGPFQRINGADYVDPNLYQNAIPIGPALGYPYPSNQIDPNLVKARPHDFDLDKQGIANNYSYGPRQYYYLPQYKYSYYSDPRSSLNGVSGLFELGGGAGNVSGPGVEPGNGPSLWRNGQPMFVPGNSPYTPSPGWGGQ